MHETALFRQVRPIGRFIPIPLMIALAALAATTFAAPVAGAPSTSPFGVVLADGTTVPAASRPLIAMGQVSFLDSERHSRTLGVRQVNLAATLARNGAFSVSAGRPWTARSLARLDRRSIQYAAASGGSNTGDDDLTDAGKIRAEIDRMEDLMAPLSASDHQRTVYTMRQRELQDELERLLSPPPPVSSTQPEDQSQS